MLTAVDRHIFYLHSTLHSRISDGTRCIFTCIWNFPFKLSYILYQYLKLLCSIDLNQDRQYLGQVAHENETSSINGLHLFQGIRYTFNQQFISNAMYIVFRLWVLILGFERNVHYTVNGSKIIIMPSAWTWGILVLESQYIVQYMTSW